ncbi:hypothetical protein LshimejAT787_1101140 [Lyophyllum shimeji]|uniref:Uncharacterized protein n=1 Tax=Lyophyllum shimeji TaxID=47721 RepID=A0A9P3UNX9_LYOSH|nr:hypothetical protein LshimejAT787_1101140 [Lyophyllum shimeji]
MHIRKTSAGIQPLAKIYATMQNGLFLAVRFGPRGGVCSSAEAGSSFLHELLFQWSHQKLRDALPAM